jgi:hypothetical protein
MSITACPTCNHQHHWTWEDAFDKFGFGDGDGLVMTDHVADALRQRGYTVVVEPWGVHNVIITKLCSKAGASLIKASVNVGYDDPRTYLPKRIVKLLDTVFASATEVEL